MAEEKNFEEMLSEATESLKNKNKELLSDLKKTQNNLKKFDGVDLDALKSAAQELSQLKEDKLKEENDFKKLYETQQNQHSELLTKKETELENVKKELNRTKKEASVSLALNNLDIIPELSQAASDLLIPQVGIDGEGKAVVGDTPVGDFVQKWSTTDVGKHFIKSGNSGGGADGSGVKPSSEYAKFFDKGSGSYSMTQQGVLANKDPQLYESLKKQFS